RLLPKQNAESDFVTVAVQDRSLYVTHPWSIGGGGASELKEEIDRSSNALGDFTESIGFASFPGADEVFIAPTGVLKRKSCPRLFYKEFIGGDAVRDWMVKSNEEAFVPYDEKFEPIALDEVMSGFPEHWLFRTNLGAVVPFNRMTRKQLGDSWWTWYRWISHKYSTPLSITFAFVATHNH